MCNDPDYPQVSIASPSDLARLSEIHGRVSFADPLARCTVKQPHTLVKYIDVGLFHYGQAFANNDAFVLKATNKTSGEIVGCAWLQLYGLREEDTNWATLCQSGFPLPDVMRSDKYYDIHTEIHRRRLRALSRNWMPHYCKCKNFALYHHKVKGLATSTGQPDD